MLREQKTRHNNHSQCFPRGATKKKINQRNGRTITSNSSYINSRDQNLADARALSCSPHLFLAAEAAEIPRSSVGARRDRSRREKRTAFRRRPKHHQTRFPGARRLAMAVAVMKDPKLLGQAACLKQKKSKTLVQVLHGIASECQQSTRLLGCSVFRLNQVGSHFSRLCVYYSNQMQFIAKQSGTIFSVL